MDWFKVRQVIFGNRRVEGVAYTDTFALVAIQCACS